MNHYNCATIELYSTLSKEMFVTFLGGISYGFFSNGVIQLDALPNKRTLIGYVIGGIMSTLPNTNAPDDTTASRYIFKVILMPK